MNQRLGALTQCVTQSRQLLAKAAALSMALALISAAPAQAQQDIIELRQEGFKAMGGAMKAVRDELKSGQAEMALIRDASRKMAFYAAELPAWFPEGSGPESGLATDALAYIWKNSDKFDGLSQTLIKETSALAELAAGADASAIKQQLLAVKDSCSACHKSFRAD